MVRRKEFFRQLQTLTERGCHEFTGESSTDFMARLSGLMPRTNPKGEIPFVIVPDVSLAQMCQLAIIGGEPVELALAGQIESTNGLKSKGDRVVTSVSINYQGRAWRKVSPSLNKAGMVGMTIEEVVATAIYFPEIISPAVLAPGSRRGTKYIPLLGRFDDSRASVAYCVDESFADPRISIGVRVA
jgi:uncharacterized membrane protein